MVKLLCILGLALLGVNNLAAQIKEADLKNEELIIETSNYNVIIDINTGKIQKHLHWISITGKKVWEFEISDKIYETAFAKSIISSDEVINSFQFVKKNATDSQTFNIKCKAQPYFSHFGYQSNKKNGFFFGGKNLIKFNNDGTTLLREFDTFIISMF
ncbi:MAG: hypothetical protein IPP48_11470 [Chitinophagaceae bacterium]|nr:hypothetical protein [Chitinophagaceae bacterium]